MHLGPRNEAHLLDPGPRYARLPTFDGSLSKSNKSGEAATMAARKVLWIEVESKRNLSIGFPCICICMFTSLPTNDDTTCRVRASVSNAVGATNCR